MTGRSTSITGAELRTVQLPFRENVREHMLKQVASWRYVDVVTVELASGATGIGDQMRFYSPLRTTADTVDGVVGDDAAKLMWDDSIGIGLQMALFDAVGETLGEPVHGLLGDRRNDSVPLAWWCVDMSEGDLLAECSEAVADGYRHVKYKSRPWYDIRTIIEAVDREYGSTLDLCFDFNGTLLDAERGVDLLEDLTKYAVLTELEEPIFQDDTAGYLAIQAAVDAGISLHYDDRTKTKISDQDASRFPGLSVDRFAYSSSLALTPERAETFDGFVLTGGVSSILEGAKMASFRGKGGKIQIAGSGLSTLFAIHLGSVLDCELWPSVDCHRLFEESLLERPLALTDGNATPPSDPGLGIEADEQAIRTHEVEPVDEPDSPDRLIKLSWPHQEMYVANGSSALLTPARTGRMPYFERDVSIELLPDDGSDWWASLYERAKQNPVVRDPDGG